jgi:hypothetical protein
MDLATLSKLLVLLMWPFLFLLYFYFKDKKTFKQRFLAAIKKR